MQDTPEGPRKCPSSDWRQSGGVYRLRRLPGSSSTEQKHQGPECISSGWEGLSWVLHMLEPMQSSLRAGGSLCAGHSCAGGQRGRASVPRGPAAVRALARYAACGREARHRHTCGFSSGVSVLSALLPLEANLGGPRLPQLLGAESSRACLSVAKSDSCDIMSSFPSFIKASL